MSKEIQKYLTFQLSSEEYGLELLKVREIIGMLPITKSLNAPVFIRGVINLRDQIIPIIDLRVKFGLEKGHDNSRTCIVVVAIQTGEGELRMGIVVDTVCEVLQVTDEMIEPTPECGGENATDCILGIAKSSDRAIILLDINKIITSDDIVSLTIPESQRGAAL